MIVWPSSSQKIMHGRLSFARLQNIVQFVPRRREIEDWKKYKSILGIICLHFAMALTWFPNSAAKTRPRQDKCCGDHFVKFLYMSLNETTHMTMFFFTLDVWTDIRLTRSFWTLGQWTHGSNCQGPIRATVFYLRHIIDFRIRRFNFQKTCRVLGGDGNDDDAGDRDWYRDGCGVIVKSPRVRLTLWVPKLCNCQANRCSVM